MATVETETKALPPYVSYETFSGVIANLKKTVVPSHIDKSIMPTLSGATQSHAMSCLRSLGLVSADGMAMAELRGLVAAHGTESWASVFGGLVKRYYGRILGDIDIETATSKQLRDQFIGLGGVDGSMADRAIRFYIRALEDTKTQFSPFLKVRKQRAQRKPASATKPPASSANPGTEKTARAGEGQPEEAEVIPPGMISYPMFFRRVIAGVPKMIQGKIIVPGDLNSQDCKIVAKQLEVLVLSQEIQGLEQEIERGKK